MLGLGHKNIPWQWSASGKHPAFGDFIDLNVKNPVVKALSAWIDRGMAINNQQGPSNRFFSYRFWTRGCKKHSLVCGIVRSSSDNLGRSYPLLLMGNGNLRNWEKQWNDIFQVFDPMFREFEEIALRRFDSFKTFEERLYKISFSPRDLPPPGSLPLDNNDFLRSQNVLKTNFLNQDRYTIALGKENTLFQKDLKAGSLPIATFMGGAPEAPMLTVYKRPLAPNDFSDLFSGCLEAAAIFS